MAEWQLDKSSFTGSTRDQRAGLGRVLAATRNTSLYSDQLSLFAGLLSSLAPNHRSVWDKAHSSTMALRWCYWSGTDVRQNR